AAQQLLADALDAPSSALLLGWLAALPAAAASGDSPKARRAAPGLLRPLYQRVRRLGDTLDEEAPPERWHLLRIRAKRLRYALELTDSLYGAPAQRLRRRLAALQDLLGEHQDAAVAAAQFDALRQTEPAAQSAALQTLLARLARQAEDDAAALRPRFAAAYARLRSPWKTLARMMKRQRRVVRAAAGPQAAARRAGSPRRKPTVELYLVRHAIAGDRDPMAWPDDRDRPLTPEGAKRFRRVAEGLCAAVPEVERVLTSPLTRAVQTAEILRKRADWPAAQPCDELDGGHTPEQIVEALRAHAGVASLAVVGHEPGLHELAAYLLTGGQAAALLEFKKGGVACLSFGGEIQPGTASLRWLLTPKLLRALAKG
ncbi:MAG: phosphohistidine phosphatase SixA, partial [Chloroflexi bacterium]|nr:phosphohistidine phosphatase SixA [Chloroflexota bacterium]